MIGPGNPPYMIAEMSGNHNGNIENAFKIMEEAKKAGADAVKLQTYTADTITLDFDGPGFRIKKGIWKGRTLYELYNEASTPWEWHKALFEKGKELALTVFSSPFDYSAIEFLEELNTPAYKVASFEIVDLPLISQIASTGKPMIISTGMANEDEIHDAIKIAKKFGGKDIALLHCVSGYPTPVSESNISAIAAIQSSFGLVTGLSDHTLSAISSIASVAMGASIVEKHFTLDRSAGGTDSKFSLEPAEFSELCKNCKLAWQAIGDGEFICKPSEEENIMFRRSIYAVEKINAGEKFTQKNIRSIRPGFGLSPKYYHSILGKTASTEISFGTPLVWDFILKNK